jgi:hypothetical protein
MMSKGNSMGPRGCAMALQSRCKACWTKGWDGAALLQSAMATEQLPV